MKILRVIPSRGQAHLPCLPLVAAHPMWRRRGKSCQKFVHSGQEIAESGKRGVEFYMPIPNFLQMTHLLPYLYLQSPLYHRLFLIIAVMTVLLTMCLIFIEFVWDSSVLLYTLSLTIFTNWLFLCVDSVEVARYLTTSPQNGGRLSLNMPSLALSGSIVR